MSSAGPSSRTPEGKTCEVTPDRSLFLRVDRDGARFRLGGGQVLRHVGVSTTMPALEHRLGGALPETLGPFADKAEGAEILHEIATAGRIRALAASLFSPRVDGPAGRLMLEGIATRILSEMIEALCAQTGEAASDLARWERLALAEIVERIRSDRGDLPIREIAARVGYAHVSNLTRACRAHFGEMPAGDIAPVARHPGR